MRWFARPDNRSLELRVAPRLASWNKTDDPDQFRLQEYLDDTEALIASAQTSGPWALRLDVCQWPGGSTRWWPDESIHPVR
ncbi:hypothetical protein [Mycolicibacterium fallax]|uniref:hypothetical protein n=1 Tax=Mycolicibacterium fallax TaxID=1793 RepID=UPI001055C214|nr:hypothetical protein [Mycolicibacterium fallax]